MRRECWSPQFTVSTDFWNPTVRHEALGIEWRCNDFTAGQSQLAGEAGGSRDVMSHVMSDHVDWRSVSEDVIRSSVRGTVPVLACVAGNCGVRSSG